MYDPDVWAGLTVIGRQRTVQTGALSSTYGFVHHVPRRTVNPRHVLLPVIDVNLGRAQ